jgi:hypothetical protein
MTYRADGDITGTLFAPDGRIVLGVRSWATDRASVVVLDATGAVQPGWPWLPDPALDTSADVALGTDASVYVAVRTTVGAGPADEWRLHRLDATAREMPGFPLDLPAGPFCGLTTAPDGTAWVACEADEESPDAGVTTLLAVQPDGSVAGGWPRRVRLPASIVGVRSDGAVVVLLGSADGRPARVTVLRPDNTVVGGWPRRILAEGTPTLGARDRVFVRATTYEEGQCGAPVRTSFQAFRADGAEVAGWRFSIAGWASDPLQAADGTTVVLTGAGRLLRLDRGAAPVPGWPVAGAAVAVGCYEGNDPVAAPDGGVVTVAGRTATWFTADGTLADGWPVGLPAAAALRCPDCTPGPSAALPPAVGTRGVWVAAYRNDRPRIIGIDRDGDLPAEWVFPVGRKGDTVWAIHVAAGGRVWVLLRRWDDASESERALLVPVTDD